MRTFAEGEVTTAAGLASDVFVGTAVGGSAGVGVAVGSGVGVLVGARAGVGVQSGVGVKVGWGVRVGISAGVGAAPQPLSTRMASRDSQAILERRFIQITSFMICRCVIGRFYHWAGKSPSMEALSQQASGARRSVRGATIRLRRRLAFTTRVETLAHAPWFYWRARGSQRLQRRVRDDRGAAAGVRKAGR